MQYSAVQYENVRENKSWIDPLSLNHFSQSKQCSCEVYIEVGTLSTVISYYDPLKHFESCPWSLTPLLSEVFHLT